MSDELHAQPKVHAELGASVAGRWMNCPGSIRLGRDLPQAPQTFYAAEGSRAHALAEICLRPPAPAFHVAPGDYIGRVIEGGEVDEDMAANVAVYVNFVRDIIRRCWSGEWWIERAFDLAALNPPDHMFGTADFVGYERSIRRLHVADLKYGQGVLVQVRGNKQLRYYALGALLSIDLTQMPVDDVEITIVQPRMLHPDGVIRSEVLTVAELMEFAVELMDAARATQDPDAPLVAGDHCKFCPAAGLCPAQREHALAVAQHEFAIEGNDFVPPAPETIPIEQLAAMARKFHILRDWMSDSEAVLRAKLERGEEVPGYKLVEKRPIRRWTDEFQVENLLVNAGHENDEIFDMDLKSPAQIEKLLGKKKFRELVSTLVEKKSSGYNMAPDTDPRPAIAPPAAIDRLLPAGEDRHDDSED